jgi:CheY-like chemotaxis protein
MTSKDRSKTATPDAARRILVVEDNADSAETMQLILKISGYDARAAYDGVSALEMAREFHPEVVFLDIGLPGKDGYQVARELRGLPQTRSALLVALTGHGYDEDRRRAAEAGFDLFHVKPVAPDALQILLTEHFAKRPV